MSFTRVAVFMLTLSLTPWVHAAEPFQAKLDFETDAIDAPAQVITHEPAIATPVKVADEAELEKSRDGSAGVFKMVDAPRKDKNGETVKSQWGPALAFTFPEAVSRGSLQIAFDIRQMNTTNAGFYLDVVQRQPSFGSWVRLYIQPNKLHAASNIRGESKSFAVDKITSGPDGQWHRVELVLPLPGNRNAMRRGFVARIDGEVHADLPLYNLNTPTSVALIRLTDDGPGDAGETFYIDNFAVKYKP